MTDSTSTEDVLTKEMERELEDAYQLGVSAVGIAEIAVELARPIIAQQEREKVLRECLDWVVAKCGNLHPGVFAIRRFATEHGITLEDK